MKPCWFVTYVMPLTVLTCGWYRQMVKSDTIPNCDPAHYYDQTKKICLQCPDKTFSRGLDSYACDKCPYNSASTPGRLSTQIEDCECEKGYYLYSQISSCVICPLPKTKYQCPGFHTFSTDEEITKSGWYLHDNSRAEMHIPTWTTSLLYDKCRDESHCNPQRDAYRFKSEALDIQCAKGHTGSLCFECLYQWSRPITEQSSSCTMCSSVWLLIGQIGIFFLGFIFIIFFLSLATQYRMYVCLAGEKNLRLGPFRKILLCSFYIQLGLCSGGSLLNVITNDSMSVKDQKPFLISYVNFLFNVSMNLGIPIDFLYIPCLHSFIAEMVFRESNFYVQLTFLTWIFITFPILCVLIWTLLNIRKARKVDKEVGQEKVNISQKAWIAVCGVESWGMCVWMMLYFYVLTLSQLVRYGTLNITCVDRPNSTESFLILAPDTFCNTLSLNDDILINTFCLIIAPFLLPTSIIMGFYHLSQWKFKLFLNTILGSTKILSCELVQFYLLQIILLTSIKPVNVKMEIKFFLLFLIYFPICLSIYFTYDSLEYLQINSTLSNKSRIQRVWEFWDTCAEFQHYCFILSFLSHICLCIVVYLSSEKQFQKILVVVAAFLQWTLCIYMILNIFYMEIFPVIAFKFGLHNSITQHLEVFPYSYIAIKTLLDNENPLMEYLVHELEDIVLKSPFPAETISQMKKIVDLQNVVKLPENEVINIVVKQGHIEPQYASCILGQRFLRTAFMKEREHSDTGNEKFSEIFLRALKNLTFKLGIENQVTLCDNKAEKIHSNYLLVHRVLRYDRLKEEQNEWKSVSDTLSYGNTFSLEKLNRIKAEFRYLFPDAGSCSIQHLT